MGLIADMVQVPDQWGFRPGDDEYVPTYAPDPAQTPAPAVVPKPTPAPAPVLPTPPSLIPSPAAAVPPAPGMVSPVAPRPTFSSVPTGSPNPGQGRAGGIVSLRTRIAGDGHVTQDDPYGVNPDDEGYAGDYGVEASRQALENLFGAGKDNVVIDEQGNAFFYGQDRTVTPLTAEERGKLTEAYGDRILRAHTPTSGLEAFPGGAGAAAALGVLALGGLGGLEWTQGAAPGFSPYPGIGGEALGSGGLPNPGLFADGIIGPDAFASVEAAQAAGYAPGLTEHVISAADLARAGIPSSSGAGGTSVLELMKQYGPTVLGALSATGLLGGLGGEEGGGGGVGGGGTLAPPPVAGGRETPGGLLARRVAQTSPAGLAPAQGYFPTLATVPQPTENEIEIQEAQLELMRQGLQHGQDSQAAILQGFGFARDPETGQIRQMSEDEYLGTLNEAQKGIYELQLLDIERQKRALNRETPVSEGLQMQRDREYEQLREALARQGHALTGDEAATAVATSTAGAQRLGRFNERYAAAEEAERAQQLARGTQSILGREGLFGNLRGERAARAANLIGYGNELFGRARDTGALLQPYQYQRGLESNTQLANQAAANEAARFRATAGNQFALARAGFEQAANLYNVGAQNQADRDRVQNYNLFRYGAFQNQQNQAFQQAQAREARRAQDRSNLFAGIGNLAGNLIFSGGGNNQRQGGLFSFF